MIPQVVTRKEYERMLAEKNAIIVDLLEALDDLVEAVDYVPYDEYSEQTKPHLIERAAIRARKAIEKAKGE